MEQLDAITAIRKRLVEAAKIHEDGKIGAIFYVLMQGLDMLMQLYVGLSDEEFHTIKTTKFDMNNFGKDLNLDTLSLFSFLPNALYNDVVQQPNSIDLFVMRDIEIIINSVKSTKTYDENINVYFTLIRGMFRVIRSCTILLLPLDRIYSDLTFNQKMIELIADYGRHKIRQDQSLGNVIVNAIRKLGLEKDIEIFQLDLPEGRTPEDYISELFRTNQLTSSIKQSEDSFDTMLTISPKNNQTIH